ncbi:MAG: signal peptidase I [Actinobacteria bacterium RBG_16_67_15]|nr:MAG: signal peptidase I [Actinobacteria bacterium RBG_16_67_15]
MAGITAIRSDHGWEPGTPEEGSPGSTALSDDPWSSEWQPRTPGPTQLDGIESWEREHGMTLSARAAVGDIDVDLTGPRSRRVSRSDRLRKAGAERSRPELRIVVDADRPAEAADRATSDDDTRRGVPPKAVRRISGPDRRIRRTVTLAAYFLALTVGAALWYFSLGTLVVSRGAALASGWQVTTVATGSMRPAINPGDLVAFAPIDIAELRPGQIVVVDDPVAPGTTLVHRFVGLNSDGTLTTKGDANESNDSTPVPADSVLGVVKMVSPFGGYPTLLLHNGQTVQFAALIAVLLLAALLVHAPAPHGVTTARRRRRTLLRRT